MDSRNQQFLDQAEAQGIPRETAMQYLQQKTGAISNSPSESPAAPVSGERNWLQSLVGGFVGGASNLAAGELNEVTRGAQYLGNKISGRNDPIDPYGQPLPFMGISGTGEAPTTAGQLGGDVLKTAAAAWTPGAGITGLAKYGGAAAEYGAGRYVFAALAAGKAVLANMGLAATPLALQGAGDVASGDKTFNEALTSFLEGEAAAPILNPAFGKLFELGGGGISALKNSFAEGGIKGVGTDTKNSIVSALQWLKDPSISLTPPKPGEMPPPLDSNPYSLDEPAVSKDADFIEQVQKESQKGNVDPARLVAAQNKYSNAVTSFLWNHVESYAKTDIEELKKDTGESIGDILTKYNVPVESIRTGGETVIRTNPTIINNEIYPKLLAGTNEVLANTPSTVTAEQFLQEVRDTAMRENAGASNRDSIVNKALDNARTQLRYHGEEGTLSVPEGQQKINSETNQLEGSKIRLDRLNTTRQDQFGEAYKYKFTDIPTSQDQFGEAYKNKFTDIPTSDAAKAVGTAARNLLIDATKKNPATINMESMLNQLEAIKRTGDIITPIHNTKAIPTYTEKTIRKVLSFTFAAHAKVPGVILAAIAGARVGSLLRSPEIQILLEKLAVNAAKGGKEMPSILELTLKGLKNKADALKAAGGINAPTMVMSEVPHAQDLLAHGVTPDALAKTNAAMQYGKMTGTPVPDDTVKPIIQEYQHASAQVGSANREFIQKASSIVDTIRGEAPMFRQLKNDPAMIGTLLEKSYGVPHDLVAAYTDRLAAAARSKSDKAFESVLQSMQRDLAQAFRTAQPEVAPVEAPAVETSPTPEVPLTPPPDEAPPF